MYEVTSPKNSGRVIAVWSPVSRQGGVSTLAAMLISYLSVGLNNDEKALLISNETTGVTAAWYLSKEHIQSGLADVVDLSTSDNLKRPEDLYNNAFTISSNIDILTSSKANIAVGASLAFEISNIFSMARKGYKYIVVDVPSGDSDISQKVIENCDVVVVCLPQDKYFFDGWVKRIPDIYLSKCDSKPTVTVLQKFFNYSSMTYSYMTKKMAGTPLYYIDLNTLVFDAVTTRSVHDVIVDEAGKKKHDEVIDELDAITDAIIEKIESVIDQENTEEQKLVDKAKKDTQDYMSDPDLFFGMEYGEDDQDSSQEESSDESEQKQDEQDASSKPEDSSISLNKEEDSPSEDDGLYDLYK